MTRPVAILGMHRSGTSCLAGCLEDCGLFLGEVNREAPHNRKGNNENVGIRDIHERVLASAGAAWDHPPSRTVVWQGADRDALKAAVHVYDGHLNWGFKDPRTVFLLEGWVDMGVELRLVGTYRHPLEVAASLERRNGFTIDQGLELWRTYNARLLTWIEPSDSPLVKFDANPSRYLDQVRRAARSLGLNAEADIHFRDEELHHHAVEELPPRECRDIWLRLEALQI